MFSKNQKGSFFLRIEDTDKERSKDEYKNQIIQSLKWIGIEQDGNEYIQSKKIDAHIKVANELLKNGHAYKCYCSNEEIEEQKNRANQKKIRSKQMNHDSKKGFMQQSGTQAAHGAQY